MKKKISLIIAIVLIISSCTAYAATSFFDLRNKISVVVKNQLTTNECWAITVGTLLETNLALKGKTNLQFSARHMDYATSQGFKNNEYNSYGYEKTVNSGGTAEMGFAYLTNGMGPVYESEMPFRTTFNTIALSEVKNKTVDYKVDKWVMFPSIKKLPNNIYLSEEGMVYTTQAIKEIRDSIKKHIMNYGAVYAAINAESGFSKYYNFDTYSYYCSDYQAPLDHAVSIIGWDDKYSKNNFKGDNKPSSDGAYIVQNSWGDDSRLKNGTFYISYEDAIIERNVYGIEKVSSKNYDNIYQYDQLGRNQYFNLLRGSSIYAANVFSRRKKAGEYLTQVGITSYVDAKCEIYINPKDGDINSGKLIKAGEGTLVNGYNTIYLTSPIKLEGTKFAVVVKYIKTGNFLSVATLSGLNASDTNNLYRNVTSSAGQSYIGTSLSDMSDIYTESNKNTVVCIKAFSSFSLKGDFNSNGRVDSEDVNEMRLYLSELKTPSNIALVDMNGDGKITTVDLSIIIQMEKAGV